MRPDHQTAHFQVSPDARVVTRVRQIEGMHRYRREDLLDMPLTPGFAGGILRALHAVKEF